ncbi:MAG: flavodoxin domain-containing protein [Actinomycetota bacterium]|nr:flavodoxin domain-containing protein [Actinomycetota bacterium]
MSDRTADTPVTIVFESMFGHTRTIAEAIADGIRPHRQVELVPIGEARDLSADIGTLIVGAPTHAHGLSRPESRAEAVTWAMNEQKHLHLDESASEPGIREWLAERMPRPRRFAAFDTRVDMPRLFTGSAASAIDRRLAKTGADRLSDPVSFFVDRDSALEDGQIDRAREWGAELGARIAAASAG